MQIWEKFLLRMEKELGKETVEKWLRPLKILNFDACNLFLEAEDRFQTAWFEEHIRKKVLAEFKNNNNKQVRIHLASKNKLPPPKIKHKPVIETLPKLSIQYEAINPICTFAHYALFKENLLLHKLLSQISGIEEKTGQIIKNAKLDLGSLNPVYIYGSSGSGKTHLLQAVTNALRNHGLKAIYARAETFTDHVVTAIRAGEMSHFRQAYRNIDALIIDDAHIFSRKGATQEEFFHTFNTLHLENKQIILSANVSPAELHLIEPRLVSRFEWGIVLPISLYSKEDLNIILEKKAEALNYYLHKKVAEFLLETFTSNCKQLVRSLEALILRTQNSGKMMTVPIARQVLADLILEEEQNTLTKEKILKTVAEQFGIKPEDILNKSQTREAVLPRQIAMHLCRQELKLPFVKIGDIFSKDHSTVMSSVKTIQQALDHDMTDIASHWYTIFKKLKN
ncbi:MAG TPA: chromosomal replication initiator protein DnaA [Parachlamydiaceae bacterium]|nr:chromosomal replication initiator protein DnaA [Parachlamydiaceae bacterium]